LISLFKYTCKVVELAHNKVNHTFIVEDLLYKQREIGREKIEENRVGESHKIKEKKIGRA